MVRCFLKPLWLSAITECSFSKLLGLLFKTIRYSKVYNTDDVRVIPRYFNWSLRSVVVDLGMGLIIPCFQAVWIIPVVKHLLKSGSQVSSKLSHFKKFRW